MTTALSIINRAAEIIGYKDPNEDLDGDDAQNFLGVLNSMVDTWNASPLFIVSVAEVTQSVSGLPITIGPTGTIVRARPTRMEAGAFIRLNDADYNITWVERVEYDSIIQKNQAGNLACYGYYEPSLPDGKIYLWPYPQTAVELHLQLQVMLTEFADLATDYTLAPGYKRALEYSLAEELAPGRRPLPQDAQRIANVARKAIRRNNVEIPLQTLQPAGPSPYAAFIAGIS
jgi:hypothetical protein